MHWYLLAGKEPALKATTIVRDKFDIYAKSYLNRLVWYYDSLVKQLDVVLPEEYATLARRLQEDYSHIQSSTTFDPDLKEKNFHIFIDSKYVIKDREFIRSIEELRHLAADHARIYLCKNQPIAILLSHSILQKLIQMDEQMTAQQDAMYVMQHLIETYFDSVNQIKIKKKKVIAINSLHDIQSFMSLLNAEKQRQLLDQGVMIWDDKSTWISPDAQIGNGTIIYPGTLIKGETIIGERCLIGPGARIENSELADEIAVKDSTVISSKIDNQTTIGPYAYLRPKSDIGQNVKIGDFVEVKNSRIDDGSKVSHLSYIGDGRVGRDVNVGCGAVFVNYDGNKKHKTVVEDAAFIGCNANLIAPVTVSQGAYVAAGSTITDDVAAQSLAIARARQVVKENWFKRRGDK